MTPGDDTGEAVGRAEPAPVGAAGPLEAKTVATGAVKPATKRVAARSTRREARTAATPRRAGGPLVPVVVPPLRPTTLAIDVGGTGLKASVLDAAGKLVADRVRVPTHYPCTPKEFVDTLTGLVAPLPDFDRVSVGFNGVVRKGVVLTAPHFVTRSGAPEAPVVAKLLAAWTGFDLAAALAASFGHPVRIANDADLQGLVVVSGSGLELVVTLGTGVGTGLFLDGKLMPHLELAHHPFRRGQTYDEQIGDAALRKIGLRKWRKRVEEALANFHGLLNYDRLYMGGGNSRLLVGYMDPSVTIVDNLAGILGGIKLWELPER
jgi:polyphosphate glucokinase